MLGGSRHCTKFWASLKSEIIDGLEAWHKRWPDRPGPEKERLRRSIKTNVMEQIYSEALVDLIKRGLVVRNGAILCLPGYRPEFEGNFASLWERVAKLLANETLRPPRVREIAAEVNVELKQLEILLSRAAAMGLVYRIADNRYFLAGTVQALAEIAAQLANEADDRMFSVKHYRDNTAIGRNLAIEVLEFFDKKKFTKRHENKRTVECLPQEIFGRPQ